MAGQTQGTATRHMHGASPCHSDLTRLHCKSKRQSWAPLTLHLTLSLRWYCATLSAALLFWSFSTFLRKVLPNPQARLSSSALLPFTRQQQTTHSESRIESLPAAPQHEEPWLFGLQCREPTLLRLPNFFPPCLLVSGLGCSWGREMAARQKQCGI